MNKHCATNHLIPAQSSICSNFDFNFQPNFLHSVRLVNKCSVERPAKFHQFGVYIYLIISLLIGGNLPTIAQKVDNLTDDQVQQFVQQAQASGLSETQIEQLALSRGFSAADIGRMRQRIQAAKQAAPAAKPAADNSVVRTIPTDVATNLASLTAATPAPPTAGLPVFGSSLFANGNLTFEPNLRIATPRSYQVGADDELIIDIFGNAQQTYRIKVSPEGSIRLENLSPIFVNGLTIEQAEARIVARLRTLYAGLNTPASGVYAQISLGNIRSIKVTLLGQVVRPGTYTLTSLSTIFNALYASGGPAADRGSFRDVRLYRNNRLIRSLDIYDFLLRADQKDNVRLQDQDIIFVDHYKTRVELAGEVKQPAIYEVQASETLRNVLNFAGGFSNRAYTASVSVRRNTPTELQLLTIGTTELNTFVPQAGDRFTVGAILDRFENKVSIGGAVFRPGDYDLKKVATLRQLIRAAEGLREDAFLNRAIVRRLRENLDPELISVDLGRLIRGEIDDLPLQREDKVTITAIGDLRERRTINIAGAVNKPGPIDFADSLTVADVVILAGGFAEGASAARIELARRVKDDTLDLPAAQNVRLFTFDLDQNLRLDPAASHFVLKPFDELYVRNAPRYESQRTVLLSGEVVYPGRYVIRDKSERITDVLVRAGGLRPEAFLPGTRFIRNNEPVAVDIARIMANPGDPGNLLLLADDGLTIPRRPELVKLRGELLNPIVTNFVPGLSIQGYLDLAGGFTSNAARHKTYVVYANGKIARTHSFLGIRTYPKPETGMDIQVPARPKDTERKLSPAERIAVASGIASISAVLLTVIRTLAGK